MSETDWIWGAHPVLEALRAGIVQSIVLSEGRSGSPVVHEIIREAETQRILVRRADSAELARIAPGQNTQGVLAAVAPKRTVSLSDLLQQVNASSGVPLLLVLDQIQDPHNVGAILRSAEAAGAGGIVLPERRSAALSGVVAKTSAGALHYLPIAEVTNLARALDEIRGAQVWTVGLDGSAPQSAFDADLTIPLALVVGGEGSGLRRLTREHCDMLIHIPMQGHVDSLNASVAAGIALFEVVRQRSRGA